MWYVKVSKEKVVSIFKVGGDLCDTVYETFDIFIVFHSIRISDNEKAAFSIQCHRRACRMSASQEGSLSKVIVNTDYCL